MPWKELSKMDERMRFVARLMEGKKQGGIISVSVHNNTQGVFP